MRAAGIDHPFFPVGEHRNARMNISSPFPSSLPRAITFQTRARPLVQVSRALVTLKNTFPCPSTLSSSPLALGAISYCEKHPLKPAYCIKQCLSPFIPSSNTRKQLRVPANIPPALPAGSISVGEREREVTSIRETLSNRLISMQ